MTSADRLRQALTVLLVAGLLLLSPALASARFTDTAGTATVQVGTRSLSAVRSGTGSYNCFNSGKSGKRVDVTVTGVAGGTAGGTTGYTYSLLLGGAAVGTPVTSASLPVSLTSGDQPDKGGATTWTLQVSSALGSWTGPAWTKSLTCPDGKSDQHNDF